MTKKEKITLGWFFGFKLPLMLDEKGEILAFQLNWRCC
ncbi:hypothetical protein PRO82_000845 [Candidatus Protochlamydia amoebophila]|nr:hypothetical protein [Candidatus Protochlamydia amoebophila]